MIDAKEIVEILELYEKHGWVLRRVLLSGPAAACLGSATGKLFGAVPLTEDSFDALWFSRSSRPGSETWELRRLTGGPYALLAVFEEGIGEDEFEAALGSVAARMRATVVRGN